MAVVHASRVRAAALCVCLLVAACDAVDLNFARSFTGLSAAAVQLVATVDPCAQPTGQQNGTAVLSFGGVPNGFPSLPAGSSANVVVDCSLQAWTATATGASFSFPGSTAVVAPFDVSIVDDSRLPVTTNVTISTSVTSSDGAVVLDLQDAFSSPYVATTRTLTFSGSGVAFGATYTTQPNCSGGTAVGVLSLSLLPAGLAALSNVAVNANVPCTIDGFSVSMPAGVGSELQTLALTYASMHSPLIALSVVFGDAAVITQPSATGVALALNFAGTYPCIPGQAPTTASGTLYVNLPDQGLALSPLTVSASLYCLAPNSTGTHVVATAVMGTLTYGDFSASGVTIYIAAGLYFDAGSNTTQRFVNVSFTGAAALDDMSFTLAVTANRTDTLEFTAVVTMSMTTPFMSSGALQLASTFVLEYPCVPEVGQYAMSSLQLSGMDYNVPDFSLDAVVNASCNLRMWSVTVDNMIGAPSFDLGPGLSFSLGAPSLQLSYDKLQPVFLNFSLSTELPSGTISLSTMLPVNPAGAVTLGGYFPSVPLQSLCIEILAQLGVNADVFSIPGPPIDLGDLSDELLSFQFTDVQVMFVPGILPTIHSTGFASVLGLDAAATLVMTAPHGGLGWATVTVVSVDMATPPTLSFNPPELADALNYVLTALGDLSSMSLIRCSAPQQNLAMPTLGGVGGVAGVGSVTLPSVPAGFTLALFPAAVFSALAPLLDAMGVLSLPTPSVGAPLLAPISGPDSFRLALELQLPDGGIDLGFGQVQGMDVFLAYDLTATPPSYSQGFGFDPLLVTLGSGSAAYVVEVVSDFLLTETPDAVSFVLDTVVYGSPWVSPFGVSPKVEVVWPASFQLGASLGPNGLDPTLLGFSGAFVSPADAVYNTNMSLDATVIADLEDPSQSCSQFTVEFMSLGRMFYLFDVSGPILPVLNSMSVDMFRIGTNPSPVTIVPANGDPIAPGFTAEAFNVSFFGLFEVSQLVVEVSEAVPPSLTAVAQIAPLSLGPLSICAARSNPSYSGPSLNVFYSPPDTLTSLSMNASVAVNGAIVLLGAEADFSLSAAPSGFAATAELFFGSYGYFIFSYDMIAPPNIWSLPPETIAETVMAMGLCSAGVSLPSCNGDSFVFSVAAAFDVGDFLGQLFVDAAQPLVQALLSALQDAQAVLQTAEEALADAQQVLTSMNAELSAAQVTLESLSGNIDALSSTVASAQQNYDAYATICSMGACGVIVNLCQSCITVDAGAIISAVSNEVDAIGNAISSEANAALSAIGSAVTAVGADASEAVAAVDSYVSGVAAQMASDWSSVQNSFSQLSTEAANIAGEIATDAANLAGQAASDIESAAAAVSTEVQGIGSDISSGLQSIGNAFSGWSDSSSSSSSSSTSTPFSSWRRRLLQSDELCVTYPCGASWGPEWSSASQFPGSTWNGQAWTEACDPFAQAAACVQAGFYAAEQSAASAALTVAQGALSAAQAAGNAALAAASSVITDAEDAVNLAQNTVNAASAAVSSAASSVGAITGLAAGADSFLSSLFDLTSFDGTLQYSTTAGSFQASISFIFMGASYQLAIDFSTSVSQITDTITAWVNNELSSLLTGGTSLRRRNLLSLPAPAPTPSLAHARAIAAAADGERKSAAVAAINSTAPWGQHRPTVLSMLSGMGNLGSGLDARYAQFLGKMESFMPALVPIRGNSSVGQVATWAKTNLTRTFGNASLTQPGRLFTLGPKCLAGVSAAGRSCEMRVAVLIHSCITSAGTGAPELCTNSWLALAKVDPACSRVLQSSNCSAETTQVLTNFMSCPTSCARALQQNVGPACGGVLAVRDFLPSGNMTAKNCTNAARSVLTSHCSSTTRARSPRACFDGIFSAVPSAVQADLAGAWRNQVDPAGTATNLTTGMKGYLHLNGENLYGALSPNLCSMDVTMLNLGNNRHFGSIPPCLFLGGTNADIQVIDLHNNALSGSVQKIGPFVRSLYLGSNQRLGGDLGAALKYAASLSRLDVSNTSVYGTLDALPSLQHLQSINVANTLVADSANASVADLLADAPALTQYVIGGNSFNTSNMRPAVPRTARGTLVISNPISSFCSRCPHSSWGSDCIQLSCADAAMVARLRCQLESYLNASVAVSAPHSVSILRMKPLHLYTIVTYTVDSAPAVTASVVAAMLRYNSSSAATYQCSSSLGTAPPAAVVLSTALADCPNGRLGATCNYFCEYGWADFDTAPVQVSPLTSFSSNPKSTTPIFNYTASGGANCTAAQAATDSSCRVAQHEAAGFYTTPSTTATPPIGALNCSAACFKATVSMKASCDTWMFKATGNATAKSVCTALLTSANSTCSARAAGPCPSGDLSAESQTTCGGDDVACFLARAAPYTQLLSGQSTPVQHTPVQHAAPPLVAARVVPKAVNSSAASVQAAVATQMPRCLLPPCPGSCQVPLQAALNACTAWLYDATQQQGCVAALGAARSACTNATRCYTPVGTGFEKLLNGTAVTATPASSNGTLAVALTLNVSVPGEEWTANHSAQFATSWSAKLGIAPKEMSVQAVPASAGAAGSRRLATVTPSDTTTLLVTVYPNSAPLAYGFRDAMSSTSSTTLGAMMRAAGINATSVVATTPPTIKSVPPPPPVVSPAAPAPSSAVAFDDKGVGVATLALVAVALTLLLVLGVAYVEQRVRSRGRKQAGEAPRCSSDKGSADSTTRRAGLLRTSESLRLRHERDPAGEGSAT